MALRRQKTFELDIPLLRVVCSVLLVFGAVTCPSLVWFVGMWALIGMSLSIWSKGLHLKAFGVELWVF